MSDFLVKVVEIEAIEKHPNADSLSITKIYGGYPIVFNHTQHKLEPGKRAVYVTVDALLPVERPEFAFLKRKEGQTHHRLKASRIRGIFSMGLLVPCDQSLPAGTDMQETLGVTKYEPPPEFHTGGEDETDPGYLPVYTDIESMRKYADAIPEGTEVVITEKIHGANARFLYRDGRLWVGSHKKIKRKDEENMWWQLAIKEGLEEKLKAFEYIAVYGEVYGRVQDLRYDVPAGHIRLMVFDALDTRTFRYLDHDETVRLCKESGFDMAPLLYRGPWSKEHLALAEGKSTLADHVREGFVVKPVKEAQAIFGRLILKMVGEGYLMRKGS